MSLSQKLKYHQTRAPNFAPFHGKVCSQKSGGRVLFRQLSDKLWFLLIILKITFCLKIIVFIRFDKRNKKSILKTNG